MEPKLRPNGFICRLSLNGQGFKKKKFIYVAYSGHDGRTGISFHKSSSSLILELSDLNLKILTNLLIDLSIYDSIKLLMVISYNIFPFIYIKYVLYID